MTKDEAIRTAEALQAGDLSGWAYEAMEYGEGSGIWIVRVYDQTRRWVADW